MTPLVSPRQARVACLIAGEVRSGHPLSIVELGRILKVLPGTANESVTALRDKGVLSKSKGHRKTVPLVQAVVCVPTKCQQCRRESFLDYCAVCRRAKPKP